MPLRDDLLNPIPGENPGGENLRYAPIYDKIKEARREDDDAPQGEWQRERKTADYALTVKLAGEAIATKIVATPAANAARRHSPKCCGIWRRSCRHPRM